MAHDMADLYGQTRIPQYVMNVAYPVIESEVLRFCEGKKAILVVEEGQPEYHEQHIHTILGRAGVRTVVHGKDLLNRAGEYTVVELKKGIAQFLQRYHPAGLAKAVPLAMPTVMPKPVKAVEADAPTLRQIPGDLAGGGGRPLLRPCARGWRNSHRWSRGGHRAFVLAITDCP